MHQKTFCLGFAKEKEIALWGRPKVEGCEPERHGRAMPRGKRRSSLRAERGVGVGREMD